MPAFNENVRMSYNSLTSIAVELCCDAIPRGAETAGAAGAAAPAALVVRGRTGAEKCPFLQDNS